MREREKGGGRNQHLSPYHLYFVFAGRRGKVSGPLPFINVDEEGKKKGRKGKPSALFEASRIGKKNQENYLPSRRRREKKGGGKKLHS